MIELPTDFTTNLTASTNSQIAEFSPVLILILGLILAIFAIRALLSFLK